MQQECLHCRAVFDITDADLAHLAKVSPVIGGVPLPLPPPRLCPDCRQQRRSAFRNERSLYRRACDKTRQTILSAYAPDAPYTVYASDVWWSDQWDALSFGREMDFSRPFFDQFFELQLQVPRIALISVGNENSEYVNWTAYCKSSYLLFASDYDTDCLYGTQVIRCDHCIDTLNCFESSYCFEVTDCEKCTELFFSKNCSNCSSSMFLSDCRGCMDCLFCTNLRNKTHHIFNKPVSPEEYARFKDTVMNDLRTGKTGDLWTQFLDMDRQGIHRAAEILNAENVSGDYLSNARNLRHCFDLSHAEDCAYCYTGFQVKDLMDYCHVTEVELGYECMSGGFQSYGILFSNGIWSSKNILYSDSIQQSSDLFGCIGVRGKHHCILNKQYTKEEYEALVPRIIGHMQTTGEWGEYFPAHRSPFPYNETLAQEYYPLTKEQAENEDLKWADPTDEIGNADTAVPATALPADIRSVQDDVLQWTISCEVTGRLFRITRQELAFYRQFSLPLPHLHPQERHVRRRALRNPRTLRKGVCGNCRKEISTTFAPDRPETVYCETCYLASLY